MPRFVVPALASAALPAAACTLCNSTSAQTLRQSLLSTQSLYYAVATLSPFAAFVAITAFIWYRLPVPDGPQ